MPLAVVAVVIALYLSLARLSRKRPRVRSPAGPDPRGRGDQPRPLRRGGRGCPAAVPRHDGYRSRHRARRPRRGNRDRRPDVGGEHAAQSHVLALRRRAGHRGAVRLACRARRVVPEPQDRRAGRTRSRRARGGDLDTHLVRRVRVHHHGRDRADHGARPRARAAAARRLFLRQLRRRLRGQGGHVRARHLGAACPAAAHGGPLPLGAARRRRGVTGGRLHPFTPLAIAGAPPALAWILPAPAGGAGTTAVALGLTLTPGASPAVAGTGSSPGWRPGVVGLRTAVPTPGAVLPLPLLLAGVPSTIAIRPRPPTMIASVVWVGALLPPGSLVEAIVSAGWGRPAGASLRCRLLAV